MAVEMKEQLISRSLKLLEQIHYPVSKTMLEQQEAADFGLGRPDVEGVQIFTIFQTGNMAQKLLVLLPGQVEPEHWHPFSSDDPGKEEVLYVLFGNLHLFVPGDPEGSEAASQYIPQGKEEWYSCRKYVLLRPGDYYLLPPGTKHWFATDSEGVVFYSNATVAKYLTDKFSDPEVVR